MLENAKIGKDTLATTISVPKSPVLLTSTLKGVLKIQIAIHITKETMKLLQNATFALWLNSSSEENSC